MLRPFPSAYSPPSPVSILQEVCEGTVSVQFTSLRASPGFQTQAVFFLQSTRKICIYYLKKKYNKTNQTKKTATALSGFSLAFSSLSNIPWAWPRCVPPSPYFRTFYPSHELSALHFQAAFSMPCPCSWAHLCTGARPSVPPLLPLLSLGGRRENVLAYPSKTHSLSCV